MGAISILKKWSHHQGVLLLLQKKAGSKAGGVLGLSLIGGLGWHAQGLVPVVPKYLFKKMSSVHSNQLFYFFFLVDR